MFSVDYSDELDTVVSGSADSTIRIWKMSSGQCVQTRYGHSDWVVKVSTKFQSLYKMYFFSNMEEDELNAIMGFNHMYSPFKT